MRIICPTQETKSEKLSVLHSGGNSLSPPAKGTLGVGCACEFSQGLSRYDLSEASRATLGDCYNNYG